MAVMEKFDDAAVLKLAKALAERDGFTWGFGARAVIPAAMIEPRRLLSTARRRFYVTLAREERARDAMVRQPVEPTPSIEGYSPAPPPIISSDQVLPILRDVMQAEPRPIEQAAGDDQIAPNSAQAGSAIV